MKRWFYSVINKIVNKANYEAKQQHFRKVASFDTTVTIDSSATITNWQNDKSKISIGSGSIVSCSLMVFGFDGKIEIGEKTFIGGGTEIWSAKLVRIGAFVLISRNVYIIDNISHPKNHQERRKDWEFIRAGRMRTNNNFDLKEQEIIIEDDVWIGHNTTIMKGVTIGKGAIIGSNTLITKDVPSFAIVVGNPQRIIGYSD